MAFQIFKGTFQEKERQEIIDFFLEFFDLPMETIGEMTNDHKTNFCIIRGGGKIVAAITYRDEGKYYVVDWRAAKIDRTYYKLHKRLLGEELLLQVFEEAKKNKKLIKGTITAKNFRNVRRLLGNRKDLWDLVDVRNVWKEELETFELKTKERIKRAKEKTKNKISIWTQKAKNKFVEFRKPK